MDQTHDFPPTDKMENREIINDVPQINNQTDDFTILYITFGLILFLIIIWIFMVSTSSAPPQILASMNNVSLQIPPVSDTPKKMI